MVEEEKTEMRAAPGERITLEALVVSVKRLAAENASLKNQLSQLNNKVDENLTEAVRKILLAFVGIESSNRQTANLNQSLINAQIEDILGLSKVATEVTTTDLTNMVRDLQSKVKSLSIMAFPITPHNLRPSRKYRRRRRRGGRKTARRNQS